MVKAQYGVSIPWAALPLVYTCATALVAQDRQTPAATPANAATVEALLVEVRQLRLALERSTLVLPRVQVVLHRMQAQQTRVDQLSQRLQTFRSGLIASGAGAARLAGEVNRLEAGLPQEQNPIHRKEVEARLHDLKRQLEHQTSMDQQQRSMEIEISGELQREQAKLDDLARQLTTLEASLGSPQNVH